MKKRLSFVLLLALLLAIFALPSASAAGNAEFGIVEMHQSGEEITMYLTRYNGEWNPDNRTYTKEQYSVNMGDAKPEITSVQSLGQTGGDIHYILLVDISGSIKNGEPEAVNQALQHFYEGMKDNEYVTLIPFGNSGQDILIREQKKSQISEWPTLKFKDGKTHMFEGIVRRLTPVECARLQGFPDWWCADLAIPDPSKEELAFWMEVWDTWQRLNGKKPKTEKQVRRWLADPYTDAAEYKLWGNGLCASNSFFVLAGIAWAAGKGPR